MKFLAGFQAGNSTETALIRVLDDILLCVVGAATCFPASGPGRPAPKSARRKAQTSPSVRDHQLSASTYTSDEDNFYDDVSDEDEHYHGEEEDGAEFDSDGLSAESDEKTTRDNKWNGPQAQPPGYHRDGSPHPVQDLPEVEAERQKHLHLYSFGAHAGAVAAGQPVQNPVPGGYATPWVPIIVPIANHYQQYQQHQPLHALQF